MYKIHTLHLGELHLPHNGGLMRDPIHCWLVTNGETHILVDSGMPDIAEVERSLRVSGFGGGHDSLIAALKIHNLTPSDISFVLLTHLHFDHASNLELFPDACVVVQRDEVLHAIDPAPTQRIYYRKDTITEIVNRKRPNQVRYMDSDYDLIEGINVIKLPSHTAGTQIPIVETAKGKVALVSDLGDHYWNWFPADPRATKKPLRFLSDTYLPSPIRVTGEVDYQNAMRRIVESSDIVVPAHDSRIPMNIPEDWWAIPESTDGDISDMPIVKEDG
jgi:N-acyl homoserine lactone hydrolase